MGQRAKIAGDKKKKPPKGEIDRVARRHATMVSASLSKDTDIVDLICGRRANVNLHTTKLRGSDKGFARSKVAH